MTKFTNTDNTLVIESQIGKDGTGSLVLSEGNLDVRIYRHCRHGQSPTARVSWPSIGDVSAECASQFAQVIQVASELARWIDETPSSIRRLNDGATVSFASVSEFRQNGEIQFAS